MNIGFAKRLIAAAVLCLVQALVLNHVHLFGCATPLLYIYVIVLFPRSMSKWAVLLWSFAIGLVVDTFSNTPGVAAASLTAIGFIQAGFFKLFVQHEIPQDAQPSPKLIGPGRFFFYVFILVLVYCILFYALETFHFFNWHYWLARVAGSTILTVILIFTLETVRSK